MNSKNLILKNRLVGLGTENCFHLVNFCGIDVSAKSFFFNGSPSSYQDKLFAIHVPSGNFAMCLGILWSEGEHEVLNDACDLNLLDSIQMKESEVETDENGNELNACRLGNASEPFDVESLFIQEITETEWLKDSAFVYALGMVAQNPDLENAQDVIDNA